MRGLYNALLIFMAALASARGVVGLTRVGINIHPYDLRFGEMGGWRARGGDKPLPYDVRFGQHSHRVQ